MLIARINRQTGQKTYFDDGQEAGDDGLDLFADILVRWANETGLLDELVDEKHFGGDKGGPKKASVRYV